MKKRAFESLVESVRQAGRIRRGELTPDRVTTIRPADVKAIRARSGKTQLEFARMIGVSPATLRNWEQGRRRPEGPARVLLRVVARHPRTVASVLSRARRRA